MRRYKIPSDQEEYLAMVRGDAEKNTDDEYL
jgi:hypothetical protein